MSRIIWKYNTAWGDFFFEAMSGPSSYAGGGKAEQIPDMPGYKGYRVEQGPFLLVDRYTVLPDGSSLGYTTQWEGGRTRLHMNYGGYYPKRFVPFLKKVLLEAYGRKAWHGGRGRDGEVHVEGPGGKMFKYHNMSEPLKYGPVQEDIDALKLGFRFFTGFEFIGTYDGYSPLGYHSYHGYLSND